MQLLDDHMFRLWRQGLVEKKEIMFRANNPDDMAMRIAKAERGIFEDENDVRSGRERRAESDGELTTSRT
jgi:twitching motility protein PilT